MRFPTRFLGLITLVAGFLAFEPRGDHPAFGPEADSTLTKTFAIAGDFSLDDFSAMIDGQDLGAMVGSIEVSLETQSTITVTDTYVATSDGRPEKLKRSYDTLDSLMTVSMATDFGGEDQDVTAASELEGYAVLFTWNEEDEEYEVTFEDEDGDEDLLEGLVEDMDLRVFLPTEEVDVDDTWEVDLKLLSDVAFPGGDLKIVPEDIGGEEIESSDVLDEVLGEGLDDYIEDLLEGTCVCTYKGVTEDEGLAEIHVAIEIGSAADMTEVLTEFMDRMADEVGEDVPFSIELADLNLDFEGEGVLLWDLEQGRLSSFELSADLILAGDFGFTGDMGGQSQSAELSAEMSGSYEYTVETEE